MVAGFHHARELFLTIHNFNYSILQYYTVLMEVYFE